MKELKTYRDVVNAILDGYEVEYWHPHNQTWLPLVYIYSELRNLDKESLNNRYRVKPTKPSIDWSQVRDEYNYLARYRDGFSYLYQRKPRLGLTTWRGSGEGGVSVLAHKSYKPGNCDWTESLTERPKGFSTYVDDINVADITLTNAY